MICPNCRQIMEEHGEVIGTYYPLNTFQQYYCRNCNDWFASKDTTTAVPVIHLETKKKTLLLKIVSFIAFFSSFFIPFCSQIIGYYIFYLPIIWHIYLLIYYLMITVIGIKYRIKSLIIMSLVAVIFSIILSFVQYTVTFQPFYGLDTIIRLINHIEPLLHSFYFGYHIFSMIYPMFIFVNLQYKRSI